MAQARFEPGSFRSLIVRSARCATLAVRIEGRINQMRGPVQINVVQGPHGYALQWNYFINQFENENWEFQSKTGLGSTSKIYPGRPLQAQWFRWWDHINVQLFWTLKSEMWSKITPLVQLLPLPLTPHSQSIGLPHQFHFHSLFPLLLPPHSNSLHIPSPNPPTARRPRHFHSLHKG